MSDYTGPMETGRIESILQNMNAYNPTASEQMREHLAALEADNTALREQIERAMEAMGLKWGDLEGFGGAVEGICDTMEALRKRVEGLTKSRDHMMGIINHPLMTDPKRLSAMAKALAAEECKHPNAVSAKNEVVQSGLYCPDCDALVPEIEVEEEA